jgi:hypothetical protein
MRVSLKRSGGFAGVSMQTTVDTATLPPAEAAQLQNLVAAADFFRLPETIASRGQPDRFQYQLAIEENGRQHTVTVGESAMPGPLNPLIEWMMAKIRQRS